MVKYCTGNFCKKKKRKWSFVYNRYPGAPRKKLLDPNEVVVSNSVSKPVSSLVSGFRQGSIVAPYTTPGDALWEATKGIGSEILTTLPGFNSIKGLSSAGNLFRSFMKSPIQNLKWLGRNVGPKQASEVAQAYIRGIYKPYLYNARYTTKNLPRLSPFSGNTARGPSREMFKYSSHGRPINQKYFQLTGVPKQKAPFLHLPTTNRLSGAGVWRHGGDAQIYNPKSLHFELNRASAIPNRANSATARKAAFRANATGTPTKIFRTATGSWLK